MNTQDITNIVFEGGGIRGLGFLGACKYLEQVGVLDQLERVGGASIGSIFAFLLATKHGSQEMIDLATTLDYSQFQDDGNIIGDAYRVIRRYGWCEGVKLEEWLQQVLETRGYNKNITLSELYQDTGILLSIIATNVQRGVSEVFDANTYPDVPVVLAIRMSTAIPFFFTPVLHGGYHYIDGGVLNNYPIQIYDTDGQLNNNTLGIRVDSSSEFIGETYDYDNVYHYILAVGDIIYNTLQQQHLKAGDWARTVRIDTGSIGCTEFGISRPKIDWLIQQGYSYTQDWFTSREIRDGR